MRYALFAALAGLALAAAGQTCQVCGEIRGIREIGASEAPAPARAGTSVGTTSGLDTAPVVGTVAGFRFDRGRAYDGEGWNFGGAAGTPEMQARLGGTTYEITVAMDAGESRTLRRHDGARFQVGQRVALRGGELEPM